MEQKIRTLPLLLNKKRGDFLSREAKRISLRYNLDSVTEEEIILALIDRHELLCSAQTGVDEAILWHFLDVKRGKPTSATNG